MPAWVGLEVEHIGEVIIFGVVLKLRSERIWVFGRFDGFKFRIVPFPAILKMPFLFQLQLLEIPNNLLTGVNLLFGPFLLFSPILLTSKIREKFLLARIPLFHLIFRLQRGVQIMMVDKRMAMLMTKLLFPAFLLEFDLLIEKRFIILLFLKTLGSGELLLWRLVHFIEEINNKI